MRNKKSLFGLLTVLFLLLVMAVPASAQTKWLKTRVCSVGQSVQISLDGSSYSYNSYFKWNSSDSTVATVSSNGVVYCKKKGNTTITASYGGNEAKFLLTVSDRFKPVYPRFRWKDCWIDMQYITPTKLAVTIHNTSGKKRSFKITKFQIGHTTYNINMKSVTLYAGHETHLVLKHNKQIDKVLNINNIGEVGFTMTRKSS